MSAQQFLIAPFETGLETDLAPFLLPQDAFPELVNLFVFRGRVIKSPGFENKGRLRRVLVAADLGLSGASPWSFNIFTVLGLSATEPDAQVQIGSIAIHLGPVTFTEPAIPDGTLVGSLLGNSGTINYATGDVVLTTTVGAGTATTIDFSYYPGLPVMGIRTKEQQAINQEQTIAFDTKYAYQYVAVTGWEEYLPASAVTWSGTDYQLFWTTNYRGIDASQQYFWVTNFNFSDPIRYTDSLTWTTFAPVINAGGDMLLQAECIIPFKDRLVCFNTYEEESGTPAQFRQRARFSQNGDPADQITGWLQDTPGKGGYIDAATSEEIITVQFIKDRLIVFFEKSTWEFVYTGNELLPFIWQRINTELGCESTFSEVPFDDGLLGVGNVGIHIANTGGVQRIDVKIPDEIFDVQNEFHGAERVYGIRDFTKETVYWTFPYAPNNQSGFPNIVLCYNYRNNTFATFTDSFTCYGYFQRITDYTWASLPFETWEAWTDPWGAGFAQSFTMQIMAGNQQGYTLLFDDSTDPDISLFIENIVGNVVTSPNHNLQSGMFVKFFSTLGIVISGQVTGTYKVTVIDKDTFTFDGTSTGTYVGGGEILVCGNIDLFTKNFMPFASAGKIANLNYISLFLDRTTDGEITFNVYAQENTNTPLPAITGSDVIRTRPEDDDLFSHNQDKIWHTDYINMLTSSFQFEITLSDDQMRDDAIRNSDFQMHALIFAASPTGRLRR